MPSNFFTSAKLFVCVASSSTRPMRLKTDLLDNQRGEHIVSPEAADDAGLLQQLRSRLGPDLGPNASSFTTLRVFYRPASFRTAGPLI